MEMKFILNILIRYLLLFIEEELAITILENAY